VINRDGANVDELRQVVLVRDVVAMPADVWVWGQYISCESIHAALTKLQHRRASAAVRS
jgi:hypothetical protein